MTPKEKAKELIKKFEWLDTPYDGESGFNHNAKQCALIVVDEIMKVLDEFSVGVRHGFGELFWEKVKNEINKL
jgi:hypothetical protein